MRAIQIFLIMSLGLAVKVGLPCPASPLRQATAGPAMTKKFEGFRGEVYRCSVGARTIGYGFNISDPAIAQLVPAPARQGKRPLTREEADQIFDVIYTRAREDARKFLGEDYDRLNDIQRDIVVDMAYNMGYARLSRFRKFKSAIRAGDMRLAAGEIRNSRMYRQTGRRGKHHVENFDK